MDLFLDDSLVLPPGDFDKRTLLPIMHMARKKWQKEKEEAEKKLSDAPGKIHNRQKQVCRICVQLAKTTHRNLCRNMSNHFHQQLSVPIQTEVVGLLSS